MTIKEGFIDFAHKYQLPFMEEEEETMYRACFEINASHGTWDGFNIMYEQERVYIFIINMGIKVPDDKRTKMAEYLEQMSNRFKIGRFSIDQDLGMIVCRSSQFVPVDAELEIIERTVMTCGELAQKYFDELVSAMIQF